MSDAHSTVSSDRDDQEQNAAPADIAVTARGDRRKLEALYLELRELAKQMGLKVEYRLSLSKPGDGTQP
jgi:hypothetical protein